MRRYLSVFYYGDRADQSGKWRTTYGIQITVRSTQVRKGKPFCGLVRRATWYNHTDYMIHRFFLLFLSLSFPQDPSSIHI